MLFEKVQLEKDEQVLKIVHKHWFLLFTRVLSTSATALLPLVAWVLLVLFLGAESASVSFDLFNYLPHFGFFYSVWLLFHWMMIAHIVIDHHLDVWIITDRRIISIDQRGLFNRHIGSFRLEKLQDVNVAITGIVATFLHYGSLEAQTASGSEEEFRSSHIPHPREIKSIILQAADTRMKEQLTVTTQEA